MRAAIDEANASRGLDLIRFNIPGQGPFRLVVSGTGLGEPMPTITDPLTIDGTTQPGYAGRPLIELTSPPGSQSSGLRVTGGNTVIRGLAINGHPGQDYVVGFFTSGGVALADNGGNIVEANFLGSDANRKRAATSGIGVFISGSSNNRIGGTSPRAANRIAFNDNQGVYVARGILGANGVNNAILRNAVFSNGSAIGEPGIDLMSAFPSLVTANDAGDGDAGPNNLQNFPVLTRATSTNGTTTVQGTLNSRPNRSYRIELFVNPVCHRSGFGEGRTFLGARSVTTNGSGNATFTASFSRATPVGQFVTATATDPGNNTSELSRCARVGSQ